MDMPTLRTVVVVTGAFFTLAVASLDSSIAYSGPELNGEDLDDGSDSP